MKEIEYTVHNFSEFWAINLQTDNWSNMKSDGFTMFMTIRWNQRQWNHITHSSLALTRLFACTDTKANILFTSHLASHLATSHSPTPSIPFFGHSAVHAPKSQAAKTEIANKQPGAWDPTAAWAAISFAEMGVAVKQDRSNRHNYVFVLRDQALAPFVHAVVATATAKRSCGQAS